MNYIFFVFCLQCIYHNTVGIVRTVTVAITASHTQKKKNNFYGNSNLLFDVRANRIKLLFVVLGRREQNTYDIRLCCGYYYDFTCMFSYSYYGVTQFQAQIHDSPPPTFRVLIRDGRVSSV